MLNVQKKLTEIKLLFLDVDGVLTDGGIFYSETGENLKRFNTLDGQGLRYIMDSGITPVVISGRSSNALKARLNDLGFTEIFLNVHDKVKVAEEVMKRHGCEWTQVAAVGDDWPDLEMLKRAQISFAPPNAHQEVKRRVNIVTQSFAGAGAVREVCDALLKANQSYEQILNRYLNDAN
jgi:3-deoxy-D-manno-octulosonate 8-phosphate phosphatase (KDO 8-P phosphatase)